MTRRIGGQRNAAVDAENLLFYRMWGSRHHPLFYTSVSIFANDRIGRNTAFVKKRKKRAPRCIVSQHSKGIWRTSQFSNIVDGVCCAAGPDLRLLVIYDEDRCFTGKPVDRAEHIFISNQITVDPDPLTTQFRNVVQ